MSKARISPIELKDQGQVTFNKKTYQSNLQ